VVTGKQAGEWRDRLARVPKWSQSTTGARELIEEYVATFDARNKQRLGARLRAAFGLV
jgi:hypothetical protein